MLWYPRRRQRWMRRIRWGPPLSLLKNARSFGTYSSGHPSVWKRHHKGCLRKRLLLKTKPPAPASSFVTPTQRGNVTEARGGAAASPGPGFTKSEGYLHPPLLDRPIEQSVPSPPTHGEVRRKKGGKKRIGKIKTRTWRKKRVRKLKVKIRAWG